MDKFKNISFFLLLLSISLISCKNFSKKQNEEKDTLITNYLDTNKNDENNYSKDIKVNSLNDCVKYYKLHNFYPDDFINGLQLSQIQNPWNRLKFIDKINENLFFIVYSYSIENEEGIIELVTCDSAAMSFKNLIISQIYSDIYIEKVTEKIYRIYGNNQNGNGISENKKNNNSEYDFDFNASINDKNDIVIESTKTTNAFSSLIKDYENNQKVELQVEENIFGELKEKEFVKAYYENKILLKTDSFVIIKVLKVVEEGGATNYLTLNSYTLEGELISKTEEIVYYNDEWTGCQIEIELDDKTSTINIEETQKRYKVVEGDGGNYNVEEDKDYLKIQIHKFQYENSGKIKAIYQ